MASKSRRSGPRRWLVESKITVVVASDESEALGKSARFLDACADADIDIDAYLGVEPSTEAPQLTDLGPD